MWLQFQAAVQVLLVYPDNMDFFMNNLYICIFYIFIYIYTVKYMSTHMN